jgi:beta-lactamase class A
MGMLRVKLPVYYSIATFLIGCGLSVVFFLFYLGRIKLDNHSTASTPTTATGRYCESVDTRLNGFNFVKPLIFMEPECESPVFTPVKDKMLQLIASETAGGNLESASVFLKNMTTAEWMSINPDEGFHPGSLAKVAVLITYLKMAEQQPGLLDRQVAYEKDNQVYPAQVFKSDTIRLGQKYSIRQLLYYMASKSDNRATVVLEKLMDMHLFEKTFSDIGNEELKFTDTAYRIYAKKYARFFTEIYNATYLGSTYSEYAASLLAQSDFSAGIAKLLPGEVKIARKFGEWGDGRVCELHECGIVYLDNKPYLLSVMTRGTNFDRLADVMSRISRLAYDFMNEKV